MVRLTSARAVLATFVLAAAWLPAAAAGPIGPCPTGWDSGVLVNGRGVCVTVEVQNPTSLLPNPLLPASKPCDRAGMHGINVTYNGGHTMACADAGFTVPTANCTPVRGCVSWSLEDCGPQSVDPVVTVLAGSVWACGVVSAVPNTTLPPVSVDITPCPGGTDPAVHIGRTTLQVCIITNPS